HPARRASGESRTACALLRGASTTRRAAPARSRWRESNLRHRRCSLAWIRTTPPMARAAYVGACGVARSGSRAAAGVRSPCAVAATTGGHCVVRAAGRDRTGYLDVGDVALYQVSYNRMVPRAGVEPALNRA